MLYYYSEEGDGGEGVVEGEMVVFDGDAGPGVVLFFWEPGGVGEELFAIDLEWDDCLYRHINQ